MTSRTVLPRTLASALLAGLLLTTSPAGATTDLVAGAAVGPAASTTTGAPAVTTRQVVFDVVNSGGSVLSCPADNRPHQVRARLVGPREVVLGRGGVHRINVLVHDAGTGGWFWNLRKHPAYDYATQLARRGETSLVLDRLGFDSSPLADGTSTCLDAQATILHQVVQHLYSGIYDYTGRTAATPPHASHVVLHAHGVGGAIAQLEAARYDDVAGLVLMSWGGANPSQAALDQGRQQTATCLDGTSYAPYGESVRDFRRLLFVTAPATVQRTASARRNSTPCGDVTSLAPTVLAARRTASQVEAPVLLLFGSQDARVRQGASQDTARSFSSSSSVRTRVVDGAGSALPLERSAALTRAAVLRFLRAL